MIPTLRLFAVCFVAGLAWANFACLALGHRPGRITTAGFYAVVALSSVMFAHWAVMLP